MFGCGHTPRYVWVGGVNPTLREFMDMDNDVRRLRELANRYADIAAKDVQDARREMWRRLHAFEPVRPPLYARVFAMWHELPESRLQCQDPLFQFHERKLLQGIFQDSLEDDTVIEPFLVQPAVWITPAGGDFGLPYRSIPSPEPGGAKQFDPPLKSLDDIGRLVRPRHAIDEEATARNLDRIREAVGDILPVALDRGPHYRVWRADISYELAMLRGIEQAMWDMADNPERLHRLCAFLSDSVLAVQDEAEAAGDFALLNHENQAMPYARELPDPSGDGRPVKRGQLWCFVAAQEMTLISPAMHEEFILRYQLPIVEKYGLVAYGCCEDLTRKVGILRAIPNLRRIAVAPVANVARCAEQIGRDYVASYRPNPAEMVCCGFDPAQVRRRLKAGADALRGCAFDMTLKDVQTVQGDPERLREWVRIARGVAEECV